MLSKFISVSETRFQNTETVLKNQQASIQGLETQIGQLSKLISERPPGSLPSNTEPNPREQLNVINVQDEEGFVEPEPEPRQETVEISLKEVHEPLSNNSRGSIHEERRLQVEELDEWRTHDKPKLHQNEPDTSPNQLKVGDKVLLDTADPHIVTIIPNEEIPLTVLSIFPFGTMKVSHPKFDTFKAFDVVFTRKENYRTCLKEEEGSVLFRGPTAKIRHPLLQFPREPQEELFQILWARPLIVGRCID
ncbi:hypothetical protein GOBAR_AA11689 [Gossypium barbadense]|uniref:Uncharacterized protein n=1 Tax=Gossypium barbadense TaxID=3634 RepID=A0A2P5Y038_GOSBA|nr:hypothetical protein GOBAR_AA11689 [Gossypium barbadense]